MTQDAEVTMTPPRYQHYDLLPGGAMHIHKTASGRDGRLLYMLDQHFSMECQNGTVLDLGCCYGMFAFHMWGNDCLASRNLVTGIDRDQDCIDWCKDAARQVGLPEDNPRFICANVWDRTLNEVFDVVLAFALIHHPWRELAGRDLRDDAMRNEALDEVMHMLASYVKPGGKLLIEWVADLNKCESTAHLHGTDHGVRLGDIRELVPIARDLFDGMEILGITKNVGEAFRFLVLLSGRT